MKDRHGDEREFPEPVIKEQVERGEDADHRGLLEEKEEVKLLRAVLDGAPRDEDADGGKESGEQNEPERKSVDAEVIADRGRRDPWLVLFELEAVVRVVEVRGQMKGENEGDERDEQSEGRHDAAFARQKRDDDRARDGDEGDQRQDVVSQHGIVFRPRFIAGRSGWSIRNKRWRAAQRRRERAILRRSEYCRTECGRPKLRAPARCSRR